MQDSVRRGVDEILTIINALNSYAGRQNPGDIDTLDFGLQPLDGRSALLAAAHQNDAFDDIVVVVLAGNAEARLMPDDNRRNVSNQNRIAFGLRQHGIVDVIARPYQPDTPHNCRLRAQIDDISADIQVASAQRLQQLRQGQPVGDELIEVDLQFKCLGFPPPANDIHDPGHGAKAALQNPILKSLSDRARYSRAGRLACNDKFRRRD